MNLDDVMAEERQAIMAEYAAVNIPPFSAVAELEVVASTPISLRCRFPVTIRELPGQKPGQAFVQSCAGLRYRFLWVHVDNDAYRADYETFLRREHHMTSPSLPARLHVDHLFNRARARDLGLSFIRTVLLPAAINVSHGAGYEKSRTRGGIGTIGRQRCIDEIALMKLWGVASPRRGMPPTPEMQAYVGRMAAMSGLPASEIERNIAELMRVASFRGEA